MNLVTLIGRLVQNPELSYTVNNKAYCRFTLAVRRNYRSAKGERDADFINCIAWDKTAIILTKFAGKGNQIGVFGNIQTNNYKDKNGNTVFATTVYVERIELLTQTKSMHEYSDQYHNLNQEQLNAYGEVVNPTPHDFEMQKKQEVLEEKYEQDMEELNLSNEDLPF